MLILHKIIKLLLHKYNFYIFNIINSTNLFYHLFINTQRFMKNIFLFSALCFGLMGVTSNSSQAQQAPKKPTPISENAKSDTSKKENKKEPKQFADFIKVDTKKDQGLFTVYFQDDKYYFEIADSILSRDILVDNRISRSGADLRTGMS